LPRVRTEHFNLYVLDTWLPDGSGVDLCREIRLLKPDSPIIFTSGAAMRDSVDEAIEAGATRYIIKPYDPFDLLEIVKELTDAGTG
jgi:DNA-binding response OmpR family regulator